MTHVAPPAALCVVDTVVLAMFVDSGHHALLPALAGGSITVPPTVLDPAETPPFSGAPLSEFARGLFEAQQDRGPARLAARIQHRSAFYQARASGIWQPVALSAAELQLAQYLTTRAAREIARQRNPDFKAKRIALGEAECAAVAITRGGRLWTDDHSIVELVRTLYPACQVERICGLLVRATKEGLIACRDAQHLYNEVFKGQLKLWSTLTLRCEGDVAVCR